MERILICKKCKKEIKVSRYKTVKDSEYTCAKCR